MDELHVLVCPNKRRCQRTYGNDREHNWIDRAHHYASNSARRLDAGKHGASGGCRKDCNLISVESGRRCYKAPNDDFDRVFVFNEERKHFVDCREGRFDCNHCVVHERFDVCSVLFEELAYFRGITRKIFCNGCNDWKQKTADVCEEVRELNLSLVELKPRCLGYRKEVFLKHGSRCFCGLLHLSKRVGKRAHLLARQRCSRARCLLGAHEIDQRLEISIRCFVHAFHDFRKVALSKRVFECFPSGPLERCFEFFRRFGKLDDESLESGSRLGSRLSAQGERGNGGIGLIKRHARVCCRRRYVSNCTRILFESQLAFFNRESKRVACRCKFVLLKSPGIHYVCYCVDRNALVGKPGDC